MGELSILIGGKAGFGIDKASFVIADILAGLGYRIYVYRDYPSLIRGGHTFSIIRASKEKITCHKNEVDIVLALNQDSVDLHKNNITAKTIVIYDSDIVKADAGIGMGIALSGIIKTESAPEIMRNSGIIGAFAKSLAISWEALDKAFRKNFLTEIDINLKIVRKGYDAAKEILKVEPSGNAMLPLLTGNEATSLGLVKGGLKAYIAYPMTPTSPILHYLANRAQELGIKVIHPESEIAVMLMACGFAYCGQKVAVGTSGGGFCLMTEGLSFSAMAELPVVTVLGQRPGPSTGLPTYSSQTELHFALNAGQGEFSRFVVAPGDVEESYYWPQIALNMSWKYRIPSIVLNDKNLGEGTYSFDIGLSKEVKVETSTFDFPPVKGKTIKINSYEHDESGVTTEDPIITKKMQDLRLQKEKNLAYELQRYECVKVHGNKNSSTAILCWGSNKGVCVEAAGKLGLKIIQVLTMLPFPKEQFAAAISGVKKLIAVESNATGQLARLIKCHGFDVNENILKYDGRPFAVDELELILKGYIK
ncbi:MAG: 2-oxoacid:acceptor oxidoreductase family protein [Candidatus Omnitrophota bacterium]